jgi:SAM-dependent methyltransferase
VTPTRALAGNWKEVMMAPHGGGAGDPLAGPAAYENGDAPRNGTHVIPDGDFSRMLRDLDTSRPNIARVHDYLLGGKDNFEADREQAGRLLGICPQLPRLARENRQFLRRAVHWLALDCQIRVFLDIGCGFPAAVSTHETARSAAPGSRVAYIDNDPVVAAHARALLADGRDVIAACADAARPAAILTDPAVAALTRPGEPCAVILAMIVHYFPLRQAQRIIGDFAAMTAPGSYLVISIWSGDPVTGQALAGEYTAGRLYNHSQDQLRGLLDGLEVIDPPGLADARHWAPGTPAPIPAPGGVHVLAALARTPGPEPAPPRPSVHEGPATSAN